MKGEQLQLPFFTTDIISEIVIPEIGGSDIKIIENELLDDDVFIMSGKMQLKLRPEKTMELTNKLMGFYEDVVTIQDYFLKKKIEKLKNINHEDYKHLLFDDFTMEPKDMNFVLEELSGKVFNPCVQITISLPAESQIGRQIMLGIKETNTNKYVGFIRLASPVLTIKPRNDIFNGTKITATEVNKYMINGAIIVPAQPFGYNYLGGKLLALVCCSHEIRDMFKNKYGDKIDVVFMETTSLYGDIKGVSQYDGLKPYMRYGSMTESDLFLFPSEDIYLSIRDYLRSVYGKPEWKGSLVDPVPSAPKMREFNKMIVILKGHLKIQFPEKYEEFNNFTKTHMKAKTKKRYYYSTYGYENVYEYISSSGQVPLVKKENWDRYYLGNLIEWWKNKAQGRYEKLREENKIKQELELYTKDVIENNKIEMIR